MSGTPPPSPSLEHQLILATPDYGPIYFQTTLSLSATRAGALFIPQSVGTALGSLGSGLIMRLTGHYYHINIFVHVLSLTSAALILATFTAHPPLVPPFIYLFMTGTAYGAMLTVTLISLIAAVEHKWQAVITSASYAFRSTGSTIGITIASAVFQNLLKAGLWERLGALPDAAEEIRRIRDDVEELGRLSEEWRARAVEAYVEAFRGVWVAVLGFAVLASVASAFIREQVLHKNLERK